MPDFSNALEQCELFPKELSSYRDGRYELNLAEFPITTVGSRFDPSVKTLSFEDDAFDRRRMTRSSWDSCSSAAGSVSAARPCSLRPTSS